MQVNPEKKYLNVSWNKYITDVSFRKHLKYFWNPKTFSLITLFWKYIQTSPKSTSDPVAELQCFSIPLRLVYLISNSNYQLMCDSDSNPLRIFVVKFWSINIGSRKCYNVAVFILNSILKIAYSQLSYFLLHNMTIYHRININIHIYIYTHTHYKNLSAKNFKE